MIYEQADNGGWDACIPDVPGLVALGTSREVVIKRIEEALHAYADDLRDSGQVLPLPHHVAGTVAA